MAWAQRRAGGVEDLAHDLHGGLPEDRLLGVEVVVEAAVGHARRLGDVADAGVEEALLLEHLTAGLDQRRPGPVALEGERLLGPRPRDGTRRPGGLSF